MNAERLLDCMELLGWTASILAEQLECDRALVARWMDGTSPDGMPSAVAEWIIRRADAAMMLPAPLPAAWRASAARETHRPGSATIH
jgi:hypothetical protein